MHSTRIVICRHSGKFHVHFPRTFLDGRPDYGFQGFTSQERAEDYAAGVAAGLRACGRSCEVVIDVPDETPSDADLRRDFGVHRLPDGSQIIDLEAPGAPGSCLPHPDDADMLDMGALDQWAQQHADRAAVDPEADPIERRLAREAEAGRFIAEARGL